MHDVQRVHEIESVKKKNTQTKNKFKKGCTNLS